MKENQISSTVKDNMKIITNNYNRNSLQKILELETKA